MKESLDGLSMHIGQCLLGYIRRLQQLFGAAFAINVIFVGWLPKIRRRFLRLRRAAERRQWRRLATLTAQGVDAVDADELKNKVDAINARRGRRNKVVSILDFLTRSFCFVLATTIFLGLLFLGEEYEANWINWSWMSLAVVLPLVTVAVMAVLEFVFEAHRCPRQQGV